MAPLPSRSDSPQHRDIHMDTAKGITLGLRDIHMGTAKPGGGAWSDDISMDTARNATTVKAGGFQLWERELLQSAEVKRKATVAQLCEHLTLRPSAISLLCSCQFFSTIIL
jgi:cell cycle protein kinase DBF2